MQRRKTHDTLKGIGYHISMDLTPEDYLRAGLANAILEGMSLDDLMEVALEARTVEDWEEAVNILSQTIPGEIVNPTLEVVFECKTPRTNS